MGKIKESEFQCKFKSIKVYIMKIERNYTYDVVIHQFFVSYLKENY